MNNKLCVDTLRCISLDMIDKANAGHPGISLSAAPLIHALYANHLVSNPKDPNWIKRDRFVLSAGHGSALLYVLLHVAGYNMSIEDLKRYKVYGSNTPGHPEYGVTEGVDISTGPLGQGIANAVGMAMAERHLVSLYPEFDSLLSHYTYALVGDGCIEEGISSEAMSLAGLYKLNKLIVLYDANDCTLDGVLSKSSITDVRMKFESFGWNVLEVKDGNDSISISSAITKAKESKDKPTIIICKTVIGYGSPLAGNNKVHGAPLGKEGSDYTKKNYGWEYPEFFVPGEVYKDYKESFIDRGTKEYNDFLTEYSELNDEKKELFNKVISNDIDVCVSDYIKPYDDGIKEATRNTSGKLLNIYSDNSNKLFGGSADIGSSIKTGLTNKKDFTSTNYSGQNISFGIREHAMCAIANGIMAHGGLRAYAGMYLVFSDYAKASLRMAAMMKLPVMYIFTHDSIMVGADGPTHQPVEQTASLRLIPNFNAIRPADANETIGAYEVAMSSKETPTALILSRQDLTCHKGLDKDKVKFGGYVVSDSENYDAIIIASGSEIDLAYQAKEKLKEEGISVRIVSMPSPFLFDKQSNEYKESVLPKDFNKIVAVDLGAGALWYKYANDVMSFEEFGFSANPKDILNKYDFTVEKLVNKVKDLL